MKNNNQYHLMQKFLSGEISGEEKEEFNRWLAQRPENREAFEEVRLIWENAGANQPELDYDPEEELRVIQERIGRGSNHRQGEWEETRPKRQIFLKAAAVILLLAVSNFFVWFLSRPSGNGGIKVTSGINYSEIMLTDGSTVYLNRNTSLTFEQGSHKREAHLSGEAYFEVAKGRGGPFFVHLENASVRVTGTSFNVDAYPGRDSVVVTVASGTIEIFNDSDTVKLVQGEKASLHRHSNKILKSINNDLNFDAWRTGKLRFKNTELREVLAVLEEHYNVSFRVADAGLLSCRFTGSFENAKLEKVLRVLSFGLNFEYRYQAGQYILTGKGCKNDDQK